jgi:hypothetical protein
MCGIWAGHDEIFATRSGNYDSLDDYMWTHPINGLGGHGEALQYEPGMLVEIWFKAPRDANKKSKQLFVGNVCDLMGKAKVTGSQPEIEYEETSMDTYDLSICHNNMLALSQLRTAVGLSPFEKLRARMISNMGAGLTRTMSDTYKIDEPRRLVITEADLDKTRKQGVDVVAARKDVLVATLKSVRGEPMNAVERHYDTSGMSNIYVNDNPKATEPGSIEPVLDGNMLPTLGTGLIRWARDLEDKRSNNKITDQEHEDAKPPWHVPRDAAGRVGKEPVIHVKKKVDATDQDGKKIKVDKTVTEIDKNFTAFDTLPEYATTRTLKELVTFAYAWRQKLSDDLGIDNILFLKLCHKLALLYGEIGITDEDSPLIAAIMTVDLIRGHMTYDEVLAALTSVVETVRKATN